MNTSGSGCDVAVDWDAVFRQYGPAVRAFVRPRVPLACVDDAVQDTFERAYRSRHRFDPSRPVWPWLVTIAKRACIEALRGHPRETAVDMRDDVPALVANSDPHRELERRMQAGAISETLAGLTPRHRRLLVGWEIEGRAFDSLAADEGLTRQALKSAICRARSGFRQGYASIVERSGLAAFAFGRLVGRLRDRMHSLSPAAEVLLGGVVVGMATAAALLAAGPIAGSQASPHTISSAAAADRGAASPQLDLPPPFGGGDGTRGLPPAPSPSPQEPTPPNRSLVPRAGGGADVGVTPAGPLAGISFHWQENAIGGSADVDVSVDCSGGASDDACRTLHAILHPR